MASTSYWGEFEDPKKPEDLSIVLSDLEDLILPASQIPHLHQPSQEETASFQILPPEMCQSDPVVLHTIRLLQHQRQLIQILTRAQTFGLDVSVAAPPFPEDPAVRRKSARLHYLNFLPPVDSPFVNGTQKPQKLEIESMTARLILRKAVATLCAHAGFTDSSESVLRILTDVVHDFMTKITGLLRHNADKMMLTANCPFQDVVEQTLQDMRMGGLTELHRMYRDRVILYHARVKQRTMQLQNQYQLLLTHVGNSALVQNIRRDSSTSTESSQTQEDSKSTSSTLPTTFVHQPLGSGSTEYQSSIPVQTYTIVTQIDRDRNPAVTLTYSTVRRSE